MNYNTMQPIYNILLYAYTIVCPARERAAHRPKLVPHATPCHGGTGFDSKKTRGVSAESPRSLAEQSIGNRQGLTRTLVVDILTNASGHACSNIILNHKQFF